MGNSSQKSSDNDAQGNTSSSDSTTATSNKGNGDKLRYNSKYLVQYVSDARPQNKETAVRILGARVLTSDKCVAILKEHEEKQKQQQEKERKRLEWEQKKKKSKSSCCRKEGFS